MQCEMQQHKITKLVMTSETGIASHIPSVPKNCGITKKHGISIIIPLNKAKDVA